MKPLILGGLQLMNAALIGIEKIASVRNRSAPLKVHGALGPPRGTHSPALLGLFFPHRNPETHLVSDTSGSTWNQTPSPFDFFGFHNPLDAKPVPGLRWGF